MIRIKTGSVLYRSTAVAIFAAVAVGAMAQAKAPFKQRIGITEFSGEMIVRPITINSLKQKGLSQSAANSRFNKAVQRIASFTRKAMDQTGEYVVRVPIGYTEDSLSKSLMSTGDYEYAIPNWMCYIDAVPNDPLFAQQWHHPKIKAPQAWDLTTGDNSIICAIVDTGIDKTHPDLAPNRIPGYNSFTGTKETDGGDVQDGNGHGTHCAGDAAAVGNNSAGVSGVGWNFKIMGIKAVDGGSGGTTLDALTGGATWAADNGADVVSVSFTGVDAPAIQTAGAYCKTKGCLLLWAAGNDNRNLTFNHPDVVVVGASDQNDQKADFSAYGPGVHVFAPGVDILSTTLGGGYGPASGTSMATPVTNGACAMIKAADPSLTPDEIQNFLESNCDNIGPSNIFGHGRINVFKAVDAAMVVPDIILAPQSVGTTEGTYQDGDLNSIMTNDAFSYNARATLVPKMGFTAGVEFSFNIATPKNKLRSVSYAVTMRQLNAPNVSGLFFLWNYQTGKYDNVGANPIKTSFGAPIVKTIGNYNKYISNTGEVKVMVRAVAPLSKGRGVPFDFSLNVAGMTIKPKK